MHLLQLVLWILIIIIFFICCIVFVTVHKYRKLKQKYSDIPGICQLLAPSVISRLPKFLRTCFPKNYITNQDDVFWRDIKKLNAKFGPVFKILFSTWPIVVVADPDFAKLIVKEGSKTFSKETRLIKLLNEDIGTNVFSAIDDITWRKHRIPLNDAFVERNMSCVFDSTCKVMKSFISFIDTTPVRNVTEDMTTITMNIILLAGFGYDYTTKQNDSISTTVHQVMQDLPFWMLIPKWLRSFLGCTWQKNCNNMKQFIGSIITEHQKYEEDAKSRDSSCGSILQILLEAEKRDDPLSKNELIANCFVFLFAGFDTTANTLAFALYLIASNKHVQNKAQQIVDAFFSNGPTYDKYDDLQYIEWIVKETLRMYPVSPYFVRLLLEDINFKSYSLPHGTFCVIPTVLLHNDVDFWTDPELFIPERWQQVQAVMKKNPYMYIPFGIGNRSCIGKRFATIESVMVLANLMRSFNVELAQPSEYSSSLDVAVGITARPKYPLLVRFTPRQSPCV